MSLRTSVAALTLACLASSFETSPALARDVRFRLERGEANVEGSVQQVPGEMSARQWKYTLDNEAFYYPEGSGYSLVPPNTLVNGYAIGKNLPSARQNCAGLVMARLVGGPFLMDPAQG